MIKSWAYFSKSSLAKALQIKVSLITIIIIIASFIFALIYSFFNFSNKTIVETYENSDTNISTQSAVVATSSPQAQQFEQSSDSAKLEVQKTPAPSKKPSTNVGPVTKNVSFSTLAPGADLPSGADCAKRVVRSPFEPRPKNAEANKKTGISGIQVNGASDAWNQKFAGRIDGNFTGTTDEIIQWGACKWGFEVDLVRAVAAQESWWHMSTVGDNGESFGLMQVRSPVHTGTYPTSVISTAFNVDYALAWRRACYEGTFTWMKDKSPDYKGGDDWGCVGAWFSGNWYDGDVNADHSGANWYISKVKAYKNSKVWLKSDFMY